MQQEINYAGLGIKIKEILQNRGLPQDSLAELVGCNTSIDFLLSEQYENSALALDNEIMRALADCDNQKKEKILKIIEIL